MRPFTVLFLAGLAAASPRPAQNAGRSATAPAIEPELKLPATVPARQLGLRIGSLEAATTPGGRITLVVAVTPNPRMHVYAPGEADYIPIDLTLDKGTAFTAEAPRYPAASSIFLPAVSQRVRAYAAPFRIAQPVTIAATPAVRQVAADGMPLTISGRLSYQACDDSVCYRPETVALTWKIPLREPASVQRPSTGAQGAPSNVEGRAR